MPNRPRPRRSFDARVGLCITNTEPFSCPSLLVDAVLEGAAASPAPGPATRGPKARPLLVIGVVASLTVAALAGGVVLLSPRGACGPTGDPVIPMAFATMFDHWNASVKITAVSVCEPPSFYRFLLFLGASHSDLQPLPPVGSLSSVIVNGTSFRVGWTDATRNGLVDIGDSFQVTGDGVHLPASADPDPNFQYKLEFHSSGGEWIGAASWYMPLLKPAPTVMLGMPDLSSGNATIPVLSVSIEYDPTFFWLNLARGSSVGVPTTLPQVSGLPGSREIIDGIQFNIPWVDMDGSGTLTGGDRFLVTGDGIRLPPSTEFTFYLLWTDDSPVSTASWTT